MEIVVLRNTNSDSGKYFDFNNEFRLKFMKRNIQNVHVHCWPTQTEGVKRVQSRASESSVPPPALWFSIIIVSRCVAGWCQQLVSSLPLLGGSSWLMCSWRSLMMDPLCVCVCMLFSCVCRPGSRVSSRTCRRPAATTAATARRNERNRDDGSRTRAQFYFLFLGGIFDDVLSNFFSVWGVCMWHDVGCYLSS